MVAPMVGPGEIGNPRSRTGLSLCAGANHLRHISVGRSGVEGFLEEGDMENRYQLTMVNEPFCCENCGKEEVAGQDHAGTWLCVLCLLER